MTSHAQEPTALSLTETITHEHDDSQTPYLESERPDDHSTTRKMTDPPKSLPNFNKPLPVRKEETLDSRNMPPVIPPEHSNRTLILCFDGTNEKFDSDCSNIIQFCSLLKKDDRSKQMVYYQSGIGTYTSPTVVTPFMAKMSKVLDEAIALHLDAHVMDGYEFLMQNYMAGDRICIFGFSRGAYTARSLAGMIHKVGLLPADNWQQVPFAYRMYTDASENGWKQSNAFKKAFSVNVTIEFVGVWDTVSSVGLIPRRLPFTTSNTILRTFRHAVSLDERRAKFKVNLWNRPDETEVTLGISGSCRVRQTSASTSTPRPSNAATEKEKHAQEVEAPALYWPSEEDEVLDSYEGRYSARLEFDKETDVEEVWFAGCHSDVGGGSVKNETRHCLSRISLRWMIRECFKTGTGIMFDTQRLRDVGLDPTMLYPFVTPRPPALSGAEHQLQKFKPKTLFQRLFTRRHQAPPIEERPPLEVTGRRLSEEEEDLRDSISPAYDELKLKRWWWMLEYIPLEYRYQRGDNKWMSWFGMNRARARFIPKQKTRGFKVHRTVKSRMEAAHQKKYVPKAAFSVEPTWVD